MKGLLATLICAVLAVPPLACALERGCCHGCGQHCCLQPVCRLACEMKTVVEPVYDCHCEDFCTMGPSQKCGVVCEPDGCGHMHKRIVWQPTCGHVHRKHVLVKHECKKEVPHYKCVVEYVCPRCCSCDGRVSTDQAGRLTATAEQLNAGKEKNGAAAAALVTQRNLFWPALFGK